MDSPSWTKRASPWSGFVNLITGLPVWGGNRLLVFCRLLYPGFLYLTQNRRNFAGVLLILRNDLWGFAPCTYDFLMRDVLPSLSTEKYCQGWTRRFCGSLCNLQGNGHETDVAYLFWHACCLELQTSTHLVQRRLVVNYEFKLRRKFLFFCRLCGKEYGVEGGGNRGTGDPVVSWARL